VAGAPPFASVADQELVTTQATIRYRDYSSGTPVILLHGYTDRLETMAALADSLSPAHRIVALDTRGFGGSTKYSDAARYGVATLDDVLELMDHLRVERAHFIGYSMGALQALNLAARHPARVLSATLLGVPAFQDTAAARAFLEPYLREMQAGGDGFRHFLGHVFPAWGDSILMAVSDSVAAVNDRGAMIASMEGMIALAIDPRSSATGVPLLVIAGTADPLYDLSRNLVAGWPGARFLALPGTDHETVLTQPVYLDAVRELIESRRRTRPDRFVREGGPGVPSRT
jgi:pimeloyl-ACP methyl ester carboxylesterase